MLAPVPDYLRQAPAYFHTRILVGPGAFLTPKFVYERGISHVINCAGPEDSPAWFQAKAPSHYVCIDAPDSPRYVILDWYPQFEETLHSFLRAPGSAVVYVHCQAGINRSAFLALTYVCAKFHTDGETMLEAFKRQRPCMFQNQVYRGQVLNFLNGRLPGQENQGRPVGRTDNRNAGLGASGRGTNSARLDVDTGRAPDGGAVAQTDDLGAVRDE